MKIKLMKVALLRYSSCYQT